MAIETAAPRPGWRVEAVPPQAYFVGSAVFHYLGPSFAVLLFARVDVLGVAWLRIAAAAAVFAAWRRPWRGFLALDRGGQGLIVGLGVVLAVMNACFYISIDRLPLATVAAIEFIGPITLAVAGARGGRNLAAVVAATAGVYMLTHVRLGGQPVGVAFAFANAALFAVYVGLAHRVARRPAMGGVDGLAAAMLVALVVATPIGLRGAARAVADPIALGAGVGVGVTSSVVPYVFDQLAMARLPRATYALFVALLPATATVIGVVVLRQLPSVADIAGVGLVMLGVGLHRASAGVRRALASGRSTRALGRSPLPCSTATDQVLRGAQPVLLSMSKVSGTEVPNPPNPPSGPVNENWHSSSRSG
jgi:inner membrane transporter RhtA